jgi:hypothetical protein
MSITPQPEFPKHEPEPEPQPQPPPKRQPRAPLESQYGEPPAARPINWFPPVVIAVLVLLAIADGVIFYQIGTTRTMLENQVASLKERNQTLERKLEVTEDRSNSMNNSLKGELMVTREKLGMTEKDLTKARTFAQQLSDEQKHAAAQIGQVGQQVSSLREEASTKIGAVATEVSGAKSDIAATRKDLDQTKTQLMSAIGDLTKANTLIARNHDEFLELKRRGERNYEEFNFGKEKQPRRVGDISLRLTKVDTKKQRYTLEVVAEDVRTEKKDKTVYEPVQFYMGRTRALYEIVVNKIDKDRITGYLATPK